MGATNTTSHYNLSQFVSTDKPAWLQDYNGDMAKIDVGIDAAKVAADTAQTTANSATSASTQNASDITALQTTISGQGSNITSLQSAVNTIQSLIGNGTPTTTDQTIIGAINELHANQTYNELAITAATVLNDVANLIDDKRHPYVKAVRNDGYTNYMYPDTKSVNDARFGACNGFGYIHGISFTPTGTTFVQIAVSTGVITDMFTTGTWVIKLYY